MNISIGRICDIAEVNPKVKILFNPTEDISFISMQDTDENAEIINIQERPYQEVAKGYTKFIDGDILVAKITPCFENGKGGLTSDLKNGVGAGSTEFHILRAISGKGDSKFLHQLTKSNKFRKFGETSMTGSAGQKRVSADFIREYKTFIPSLSEQKKIAEILFRIDITIQKKKLLIYKIKILRKALAENLFTRGINQKTFKNSIFGKIPNSWEIIPLGNINKRINVGYVGNVSEYYCESRKGIPFYRTQNVRKNEFIKNTNVYVQEDFHKKNLKSKIENGDVLISRVGANLGMTCKVEGLDYEANAANVIIIKKSDKICSDFLVGFLNTLNGEKSILVDKVGGAQGVFNTNTAKNLLIPCPKIEEQVKIANVLSNFDKDISDKQESLKKIQSLKKSLMQDLLSGRKRVNI